MYYLNFGVYYLDMQPVDKPLSNLPKLVDWHLWSRFESFKKNSVAEHNLLFSLEAADQATSAKRATDIASFCLEHIFPEMEVFGQVDLIRERLDETGEKAFEPFRTQMVARRDIVHYIQGGQKFEA